MNLRKKQKLYINDGTYGSLFDAGFPNIVYPSKLITDRKIISKKLTDFLQENFGQSVGFSSFPDMSSPEKEEEPPAEQEVKEKVDIFDFNYLPKDICAHLDRFVIRQEEAKKALSIAVCDHYHHAKYLRRLQEDESQDASSVEFAKQNVVIVGPTGVGKTELAKTAAEMFSLPLVRLQCYEGLDESKAIYEWKYGKQLLYTQVLKEALDEVSNNYEDDNSSIDASCLLYTSPSPRDGLLSRIPSSA